MCKAFDKIAADQLNIDSHFIKVGKLIKLFECYAIVRLLNGVKKHDVLILMLLLL